ncbi:hypothetical protein [Legionella longbeachae]|uniref:Secreted protein n=1 Tax=Legionella longbeachae serogroup 1 (strain NSW150) TaxID=661367 RepID=D3HRK9_LEGLN|nr:hypothetical protein [Legionella longbeachae]VEE02042.1 Uncharacterised protein [Legionella oakridgensis]HBD7396709.1 hypothetical protein [Legionella pneumophila]ARB91654.1 hypothetical protein A6J40_05420 [Legionella longbeachae]ARM35202.1 hypothetical protein B0B39_17535 [Legionella longbeachae]EEZ95345.1 conserved hypothetical protein [Legionella longbeachae D-4968]
MKRSLLIILSCLISFFYSTGIFANDTIRVQVKTNEKSAAALGFVVEGKKSGTAGKSYLGRGPSNKKYVFGFRKHTPFGDDIICGSKTLTKDSTVTLVVLGDNCSITVD